MPAAYLEAHRTGRLRESIERGLRRLSRCTLCPRMCKVNRMEGETGFCRTGRLAVVASYGPHFGEEDPLVGESGSGTVFFSYCNLLCVFCQNEDISYGGEGVPAFPGQLAAVMLELQDQGCHNINFVTPSHVIPQILEALPLAVEGGLRVPLTYNSSGYDRVSALRLLDGIVDIYMPDFKFWDTETARDLCTAPDYPERARKALREMHRQVGALQTDARGIAERGVLVRHLVMPEGLAGSEEIFDFIANEISPDTYVNVMGQYRPCAGAVGKPRIGRRVGPEEVKGALDAARKAGLRRLDARCRRWMVW